MLGVVLAAAVALSLPPGVKPWPIGVGPGYRIAAAPAPVRRGLPLGRLRCESRRAAVGVHLELFARRRVVIVPAGIGVARPRWRRLGQTLAGRCRYPASTVDPTGVILVDPGSRVVLADLFRTWGQPLARFRLASFRTRTPVLAFVGGRRWRGDPGAIPLRAHAQIVLELGGYVPPHPRYLFPAGL